MSSELERVFSVEVFDEPASDSGIFTWDIEKDLLFADRALADLFGMDGDETARGLPLEKYLARVHPDDRPHLAKDISRALMADVPQQDTYRVRGLDSLYRLVAAFGRAFRSNSGSPILYSGIVIFLSDTDVGVLPPN